MDFTGRPSAPQSTPAPGSAQSNNAAKRGKKGSSSLARWGAGLLGLALVVLVAAAILIIGIGGPKSEDSYVKTNRLQAVFLNTGQVYFGNIETLNNKYILLQNIYYLQTASSSSKTTSTSVSLVKLGCELHRPYDQMLINRDQVTFWENLQSNGQVATAVATFQKNNPNGQKCSDQSSASSSTTTNVQGSTSTGTTGSGSTSTGTGSTTTK